jgi:hypothetical protein
VGSYANYYSSTDNHPNDIRSTVTQGSPEGVLIEDLAIASPETLNQYPKGQKKPRVIEAFVFNKATQQGGVTLRLGARQNRVSHLLIEVEDTGIGISLQSEIDIGQVLSIDLPLQEALEQDISKSDQISRGRVTSLAPGPPEYRILIVEDQRYN